METRKIQQVGGGTFTVSLPQDWAQAEGIGQGDVVDLHTHIDGTLVVETRDREPEPTGGITIELRDTDSEQIRAALWAAYTAGYTEIILTAKDTLPRSQRRVANEVANVLAGATVTTTTEQELVIDVLLDPDEISVRQLVRQLSYVAISMHKTAMAAVADPRSELDLADRDDQADRLFAMTERSFTRALARLSEVDSLGVTRPELFELWSVARDLERVADHAERIGTIACEFDSPPDGTHVAALESLAERARAVVDYAVSSIVDNEGVEIVCEALRLRSHVREEVVELDRRLFRDDTADYRLARLLDSIQRTAEHGGNIAERGLQRESRHRNGDSNPMNLLAECDCDAGAVNVLELSG
ncbi:MAG: PhoU domain-containing protein [Halobacteriales archaeon]